MNYALALYGVPERVMTLFGLHLVEKRLGTAEDRHQHGPDGETWVYVGSKPNSGGRSYHFKHDCHPKTLRSEWVDVWMRRDGK